MPGTIEKMYIAGYNVPALLALCYGATKKLAWTVKSMGDDFLVATCHGSWPVTGGEISLIVRECEITAAGDGGNIKQFQEAIENIKMAATGEQMAAWQLEIESLKEKAATTAGDQAEVSKWSTGLTAGSAYVTYAIIAINVIVFIAMAANGVSIFSPTGPDIIKWGGNYGPYTYTGDWWRLLSSVFVHIGIIHLLFNMFVLCYAGIFLEPMLGRLRFTVAYLCTGIGGSLVSLWWHHEPLVSAGASGALFGMFGLFIGLLSTNLIPQKVRRPLLQNIAIFVGYNLLFGLKSNVDNAAHIGGLISGLVIGYFFYFDLRNKEENTRIYTKPLLVCAVTLLCAFLFLKNAGPEPQPVDEEEFSKTLEHFAALEELAIGAMQPGDTASKEQYLSELKKTALNDWVECVNLFERADKLDLPAAMQVIRNDMLQYSKDRVQQTLLVIKATEEESDQYNIAIDSVQKKIDLVLEKLQSSGRSDTQ
jgi:rhomboid protease GluP